VAVTRTQFLVQFPEFTNAVAAQVDAFLAAAELEVDRDVWDAKADQGVMYLTAHKLALSPYGNAAKMVPKKADTLHGETSYGTHYDALVTVVSLSAGCRVA
jgi:hypothetical protein